MSLVHHVTVRGKMLRLAWPNNWKRASMSLIQSYPSTWCVHSNVWSIHFRGEQRANVNVVKTTRADLLHLINSIQLIYQLLKRSGQFLVIAFKLIIYIEGLTRGNKQVLNLTNYGDRTKPPAHGKGNIASREIIYLFPSSIKIHL